MGDRHLSYKPHDKAKTADREAKQMKCKHCGIETYMPFKCPLCSEYFCPGHRLPENHACPEYARVKTLKGPVTETPQMTSGDTSYQYTVTMAPLTRRAGFVGFSPTELKHLLVGVLLILAIGFSMPLYWNPGLYQRLDVLVAISVVFSISFLGHELAHKITAQRQGLWAEFRVTLIGALITLLSILSPIKLISPGAIMTAGVADKKTMGKSALAGPVTNIGLALLFLAFVEGLPLGPLVFVFYFGLLVNSFIALFNLIPFGILDGFKVFSWNKAIWAVAFATSLVLTVYSNILSL